MLNGLSDGKDLPYASSLCGACREACPVNIDIPKMLLHMRKELTEGETYPEHKTRSLTDQIAMKIWRFSVGSSSAFKIVNLFARIVQFPLVKDGWIGWLPKPFSGWTRYRYFPAVKKPFSSRRHRNRWFNIKWIVTMRHTIIWSILDNLACQYWLSRMV